MHSATKLPYIAGGLEPGARPDPVWFPPISPGLGGTGVVGGRGGGPGPGRTGLGPWPLGSLAHRVDLYFPEYRLSKVSEVVQVQQPNPKVESCSSLSILCLNHVRSKVER